MRARGAHLDFLDKMVAKSPDAFRTISEVADDLDLPQHVLRFWETRFVQIKPMKRGGGRRYYRPDDVDLLRGIRFLLYGEGYTIRGVQRILKEQGPRFVIARRARRVRRRSRHGATAAEDGGGRCRRGGAGCVSSPAFAHAEAPIANPRMRRSSTSSARITIPTRKGRRSGRREAGVGAAAWRSG